MGKSGTAAEPVGANTRPSKPNLFMQVGQTLLYSISPIFPS